METASLNNADGQAAPVHVAIIMDGNGRWAKARGLPRTAGHKRGAESVRRSIKAAINQNVRYLTLFGFSSENWKRPADEVQALMGLLRFYLKSEIRELAKEGVRLKVIGDRFRLESDIVSLIEEAEQSTASNTRLVLTIALSYGGRAEIIQATKNIAEAVKRGELTVDDITEETVTDRLFTSYLPDPDLLIRTSGEQRISNFLLWQCAYTEFVFLDTLWPDFSEEHFYTAINEYQGRDRRYGTS